ncbi:heavy metal translocating P-type ATPase [Zongyangia hominis]|uniref:Copper-exporting P-type ATPase n=1 Tax=Zongyangia hominis TaxID=2763677 RepID=A0A926IB38_9FIRM|nr:heavy metal translocating P-type ATPase [Zongyangia hominis]MBC8570841.1 heavy metal translocating P-type ATPase [Zongyangia hominis]
MKQKFDVTGMTCSACSAHVEKSVRKLEGVQDVSVNLLQNSMQVEYDETVLNPAAIVSAVEQGGYGASLHDKVVGTKTTSAAAPTDAAREQTASMKRRLILSFCFLIPLMYISMGHMLGLPTPAFFHGPQNALIFSFTQFLLTLPVIYINRKYYEVGFPALFRGAPNMDSLIAIGSSASLIYGVFAIYQIGWGLGHGAMDVVNAYSMDLYFESASMILTLITVGKFLETRSKGKTSEAIEKLMNLTPKTATVIRDGKEVQIPVDDVLVGDVLAVRPGQSVPVDGVILEGASAVDESALTGESIPVEKAPGDPVIAATINKSGYFTFRATKVGENTTLSQIIQLVEDANATKAPIAKLADKVSGVFVPVVISIAVLSCLVWLLLGKPFDFALSIGIAVLVISCPCALGLATPVAIMVGTGKGAQNGILFKSAEALEVLHHVDAVVLDKTGTITQGTPSVTDLLPAPGISAKELMEVAAALERPSEHPLAQAVTRYADEQAAAVLPAGQFAAVTGFGVEAVVDGSPCLGGNKKLMAERGVELNALADAAERLANDGKTPLFFARDGRALGLIAVADVVKPTSKEAIDALRAMGVEVTMLTGDNERTARAIQRELGLTSVIAEVLPADKERQVRRLQEEGKRVAMVGDGINDAPALARADVGVAIGAGTDVAIESADVVLMKSDLLDAVTAIELSRSVIRNIKQNLFWAFFYNAIGIPLAAGVFFSLLGWKLSPMFGAAAMSLSSVCVVSNALRLKFFKPRRRMTAAAGDPIISSKTKGETAMKKTMIIEGMMCAHCSGRVESALNAIDGVSATVNLEEKSATVTLSQEVGDDVLTKAVTDAGYTVTSIA